MDALRIFIPGAKKSLSDILFSARPHDLPSALALAQEVEPNHERYTFATNFARSIEERAFRNENWYYLKAKNPALENNPIIQERKFRQSRSNLSMRFLRTRTTERNLND